MRALAAAAAALCLAAATASAAPAGQSLIYKIDRVTAAVVGKHLVVKASGAVTSGGWSLPRLHLVLPHKPETPSETIQFLAKPPLEDAVVIQALLPVSTTATFPLPRYAVTQVTVVGETNSVTAPVEMH
jgi:hypothetical protein